VGVGWGIAVIGPVNLSEHTRKLIAMLVKPMVRLHVLRIEVDPDDGPRIGERPIKGKVPARVGRAWVGNEGIRT